MTVRVGYDRQADALVLILAQGEVAASREAAPGVIVNVDDGGDPVSVEVLGISRRTRTSAVVSLEIDLLK